MGAALSWLNDVAQWLGRWVPRLVLVEPTHRGVRFGPRGNASEVGPGLVIYWPITHTLLLVPVTTQSIQLATLILPHSGDASVIPRVLLCSAAIQFRVEDAVQASTRALHLHALVDNRAQAAIARHVALSADLVGWADVVAHDLRGELLRFGVTVERLDFMQSGIGVALKNVADWSYSDRMSGTRPD